MNLAGVEAHAIVAMRRKQLLVEVKGIRGHTVANMSKQTMVAILERLGPVEDFYQMSDRDLRINMQVLVNRLNKKPARSPLR